MNEQEQQIQQAAQERQVDPRLERVAELIDHAQQELLQAEQLLNSGQAQEAFTMLGGLQTHFISERAQMGGLPVMPEDMRAAFNTANTKFNELYRAAKEKAQEAGEPVGAEASVDGNGDGTSTNEGAQAENDNKATIDIVTAAPATTGEVIAEEFSGTDPAPSIVTAEALSSSPTIDNGAQTSGGTTAANASEQDALAQGSGEAVTPVVNTTVTENHNEAAAAAAPIEAVTPAAPTPEQQANQQREVLQNRITTRVDAALTAIDGRYHTIPATRRQEVQQQIIAEVMARYDRTQAQTNEDARRFDAGRERMNLIAAVMGILTENRMLPTAGTNEEFDGMMNNLMNGFYGQDTMRVGRVFGDGSMQYEGERRMPWNRETPRTQVEATTVQPERQQGGRRFLRRLIPNFGGLFGRRGTPPAGEVLNVVQQTRVEQAGAQPGVAAAAEATPAVETPVDAQVPAVTETAQPATTNGEANTTTTAEAGAHSNEPTAEEIAEAIAANGVRATATEENNDGTPPPPEAPAPANLLARLHEVEAQVREMPRDQIEGINPEQLDMIADAAEILNLLDNNEGFVTTATQEELAFMDTMTGLIRDAYNHQLAYLSAEQDHPYNQRAEMVAELIAMVAPALYPRLVETESNNALEAFIETTIADKLGPEPRAARQNRDRAAWRTRVAEVRTQRLNDTEAERKALLKGKTREAIVRKMDQTIDAVDNAVVFVATLDIRTQRALEGFVAGVEARIDQVVATTYEFTNELANAGDQLIEGMMVLGVEVGTDLQRMVTIELGEKAEQGWDRTKAWAAQPFEWTADQIRQRWNARKERLARQKQERADARDTARQATEAARAERRRRAETPGRVRQSLQGLRDM